MTLRGIQAFLDEQYATEVSPKYISLADDNYLERLAGAATGADVTCNVL